MPIDWRIEVPVQPEQELLEQNTSGGLNGPQPLPSSSISGAGDGSIDIEACFIANTNHAPNVIRSYSETSEQAFLGPYIENYGSQGSGAPLPDQTLGIGRLGFRGMADEPLPIRSPKPDSDGDHSY